MEPTEQVVLVASNLPVSSVDAALLSMASAELRDARPHPSARLWVLLHEQKLDAQTETDAAAVAASMAGVAVCAWTFEHVRRALPAVAAALDASPSYARYANSSREAYLARYWWMHTSLLLWSATFSHAHPRLKYLWRLEADVQWAGRLSTLLDLAARTAADLVLHKFATQAQVGKYGVHGGGEWLDHWEANQHLLTELPPSRRLFSLVSAGRYSPRFLRLLTLLWRRGVVGYEEILLPVACSTAFRYHSIFKGDTCTMAAFSAGAGVTSLSLATAALMGCKASFRFRPEVECAEFVEARRNEQNQLWHPVKERACILDFVSGKHTATRARPRAPGNQTILKNGFRAEPCTVR